MGTDKEFITLYIRIGIDRVSSQHGSYLFTIHTPTLRYSIINSKQT